MRQECFFFEWSLDLKLALQEKGDEMSRTVTSMYTEQLGNLGLRKDLVCKADLKR